MQKYIYKVEFVQQGTPEALQETLNATASLGYRCVHFQHNPNASYTLIFEMQKAPSPIT